MELKLILPEDLANKIAEEITKRAAEIAMTTRLVNIREATKITRHKRMTLTAAIRSKQLPHYLISGKPHFRVSDLWDWINKTRVEAKNYDK
jgi:hypothetical protein